MLMKRLPLHEIDPNMYAFLIVVFPSYRVAGKLPEAVLPSLPFSLDKIPAFYLKDMSQFSASILEESRAYPKPAYVWSDSLVFYTTRAAASPEVVPLVELVKQVRFV